MNIRDNLSSKLKVLRRENNVTSVQLAKELGISQQAVSQFENKQSMPTIITLVAIADYFKVSTDYLLGRTDNPNIL